MWMAVEEKTIVSVGRKREREASTVCQLVENKG